MWYADNLAEALNVRSLGSCAGANRGLTAAIGIIATILVHTSTALQAQTNVANRITGTLVGSVLVDSTDAPIANAEILVPALRLITRTDSAGTFQLGNIPRGKHVVVVRQVGFEPFEASLVFSANDRVEADFVLKPVVTKLADIRVKGTVDARYATRLADFEERRKFGFGRFITSDVFEKEVGQNMSQILVSRIPGVRTKGNGSEQVLISRRSNGDCVMQVFLNGLAVRPLVGQLGFDINSLQGQNVIGFEFYTVATTPSQFTGTLAGHCGTVLIWTK